MICSRVRLRRSGTRCWLDQELVCRLGDFTRAWSGSRRSTRARSPRWWKAAGQSRARLEVVTGVGCTNAIFVQAADSAPTGITAASDGLLRITQRLIVAKRIDHNRACLSVARKLCRRAYHILRELEDDALAAINEPPPTTQPLYNACGCVYSVPPANRQVVSDRPEFWHPTGAPRPPLPAGRVPLRPPPR
jgi:hypothetical protein